MRLFLAAALFASAPAAASTMYVSAFYDEFFAVDTTTWTYTQIGTFGGVYDWGELGYDPTTDTLYMTGGRANQALYIVDMATGIETLVGYHNQADMFAMAVDPSNGQVYGLQGNSYNGLWEIDSATGAATLVGAPGFGFGGADWGFNNDIIGNMSFTSDIYSVNPSTGAATFLGSAGIGISDNGLAVDQSSGMIYIVDHSSTIYEIDPGAGYSASAMLSGLGYMSGATIPSNAAPRFTLSFNGACPGPNQVRITNGTPSGNFAVARGSGAGSSTIPGGPCAGRSLPIANARLVTTGRFNGAGAFSANPNIGGGLCGKPIVAVDLATCRLTNIAAP